LLDLENFISSSLDQVIWSLDDRYLILIMYEGELIADINTFDIKTRTLQYGYIFNAIYNYGWLENDRLLIGHGCQIVECYLHSAVTEFDLQNLDNFGISRYLKEGKAGIPVFSAHTEFFAINYDAKLHIFDTKVYRHIFTFSKDASIVEWHPSEATVLAVKSNPYKVTVVSALSGKEFFTIPLQIDELPKVYWREDGKQIGVIEAGVITIWDVETKCFFPKWLRYSEFFTTLETCNL
jgi:hypothetical protein